MSNISVNTITDASGGSTASINGLTPQASNMAGTNLLINGNFSISQRGTSFSHNNSISYSLDRWAVFSNGVSVNTQESFTVGQTGVPDEPKHYLKWTISSFSAGDNLFQRIEGVRSGAGQTLTLSFWAKADSAITNTPRLVQNFGSGGSAEVATTLSAINLTTAWQQFVITVTLPSISGKTIGSSDYLELELLRPDTFTGSLYVSQVMLEAGSTASSFAHENVGDTLRKCQRYYWKAPWSMRATKDPTGYISGVVNFPNEMRATPAITLTALSGGPTGYVGGNPWPTRQGFLIYMNDHSIQTTFTVAAEL